MLKIHIFCPKEDKEKSKWFYVKFPITAYKIVEKCPHYLSGLTLSRGGIYSKNYRCVNGKKIHGGYAIRIFEYISIKFGFVPNFINGFSGRYNPTNNTWNGIMGKVIIMKF